MHRAPINILIIIIALALLMDVYVFSGLKTLTKGWRSRLLQRLVKWGFPAFSLGITALLLIGIGSFRTAKGMTPYHEWILSLFLALFLTKLFFSVILLLGDTGRGIIGIANKINKHHTGPAIPSRRRFISEAATLFAAIPFTGFLYAMLKGKYDYRVHRETLYFPDLPPAFDGFTITQLSDIHSGSFDSTSGVQQGIDLAKAQKSDLFVFTGDLVNNAAWEIEPWLPRFGDIKAPYGQYSILGNHDYGDYIEWASEKEKADNLEKLKAHHKTLDYRLLLDEHVSIEKDGQKITLLGVQNWGRGFIQLGDLEKALHGVDPNDFKILLSHDPTHWEEKIRYHPTTIHLTLAGHTHGAQFGVESDKWRWSPVQYRYLDWAGLAVEKGRYLYVNRGFGFLAFSGRLGIWPEITVITLKRSVG
jgi:predicted MPP superfamily phosphohydrolase